MEQKKQCILSVAGTQTLQSSSVAKMKLFCDRETGLPLIVWLHVVLSFNLTFIVANKNSTVKADTTDLFSDAKAEKGAVTEKSASSVIVRYAYMHVLPESFVNDVYNNNVLQIFKKIFCTTRLPVLLKYSKHTVSLFTPTLMCFEQQRAALLMHAFDTL